MEAGDLRDDLLGCPAHQRPGLRRVPGVPPGPPRFDSLHGSRPRPHHREGPIPAADARVGIISGVRSSIDAKLRRNWHVHTKPRPLNAPSLRLFRGTIMRKFSFCLLVFCLLILTFFSVSHFAERSSAKKVIVLGFDGADPVLARKYMAEGLMPNFQRLASEGYFQDLTGDQPAADARLLGLLHDLVEPGPRRRSSTS